MTSTPEDPTAAALAAPCDFAPCEDGGEPCTTHERLWAHADNDHELCGSECTAKSHTCDNCDGIDPQSCFMNPGRVPGACPGCGCEEHIGFCKDCGCLDNRTEKEKSDPFARVQHSGPDTEFCALCLSGEHERVTGAETPSDTLPQWLFKRFSVTPPWNGPIAPEWSDLSEEDQSYWKHHADAVRRAVARDGFRASDGGVSTP